MTNQKLTDRNRVVLGRAQDLAAGAGHAETMMEHVWLAVLTAGNGAAAEALRRHAPAPAKLVRALRREIGQKTARAQAGPPFAQGVHVAIERAFERATGAGRRYAGTEDLLYALTERPTDLIGRLLIESGLTCEMIRTAIDESFPPVPAAPSAAAERRPIGTDIGVPAVALPTILSAPDTSSRAGDIRIARMLASALAVIGIFLLFGDGPASLGAWRSVTGAAAALLGAFLLGRFAARTGR